MINLEGNFKEFFDKPVPFENMRNPDTFLFFIDLIFLGHFNGHFISTLKKLNILEKDLKGKEEKTIKDNLNKSVSEKNLLKIKISAQKDGNGQPISATDEQKKNSPTSNNTPWIARQY